MRRRIVTLLVTVLALLAGAAPALATVTSVR